MSPGRILRPPSSQACTAKRPMLFWDGVSSHSTWLSACVTLPRPPWSVTANWSSTSISRSVLPIQWPVGRCPALIMGIRSLTSSSTV